MFEIKLCRRKGALEALPKGRQELDLERLKEQFEVLLDAGIVVVLRVNGFEVVVHSYGKIMFKDMKDEEKARKIAEEIYEISSAAERRV